MQNIQSTHQFLMYTTAHRMERIQHLLDIKIYKWLEVSKLLLH